MSRSHLRLVLPLMLAMALLALMGAAVRAGVWDDARIQNGNGLVVHIEPASTNVEQSAAFTVTVGIQDAQDLGAFQFNLGFDPAIVQVNGLALSPFLGSTGRNTAALGPEIDNEAGLVRYGAFSYGSQPGPGGDGTLVTITLTAQALGTTVLDLDRVRLSDTAATAQTATVQDGTATVVSCTETIPLDPGWNLISLPLEPDDPALEVVLSPISGNYDQVHAYHGCDLADPWKEYVPGGGDNDLTALDIRYGYWVHATASVTLTITGTQPAATDIPLCSGQNLIGWPSSQAVALPDALSSIADDYDLVYGYDPSDATDPWKQFDPDAPSFANDLTTVEPGKGTWVRANTACTLTVVQ